MAGTYKGGLKAAEKNKANDPDFYRRIGSAGGKARNPNKGFGNNRELASTAGRKGGLNRWQSKVNSTSSNSTSRTVPTTGQSTKSLSTSNGGDLDRKTSGFLGKKHWSRSFFSAFRG